MKERLLVYGTATIITSILYLFNRKKEIGRLWLLPFTLGCLLCFVLSLLSGLLLG